MLMSGCREAGAVILKIAYGYNIEPHGSDPLVTLVNDAMEEFSLAAAPGKWIVDTIPFRKMRSQCLTWDGLLTPTS